MKIIFKNTKMSSGYQVLGGHCCYTEKEMQNYCSSLDPSGISLKVVEDTFDCGHEVVPPISEPLNSIPRTPANLEVVRQIIEMLDAGMARNGHR